MRCWVILMVVALAGCATSRPASQSPADTAMHSSPLVGQRWELILIGTDEYWQGRQPAYFSLSPDNGRLRFIGSNGCNRLTGTVTLGEGQRIDFGNLASTRMACPGIPQAAQVNALLSQAYRYLIDHDRLVLFGPDSLVLGAFQR
ncbi:Heat shock protein HslJ [Modicisalibacter muralis]|uniref:Heat shock protein HslJ n=1 Tax=Modicisalibacter muralis TaxID=119000 RepID=A0A1G9IJ32_9GAMM|nr:META domain-containing protein [Halomonas muralis]SDL25289.1 Heat shock protein HslJ [Halomonas muralis]